MFHVGFGIYMTSTYSPGKKCRLVHCLPLFSIGFPIRIPIPIPLNKTGQQKTWCVPGQIDRVKAHCFLDFGNTTRTGQSWAPNLTMQVLAQSELWFLSYRLGHFHKVAPQHKLASQSSLGHFHRAAPQHFLLRTITGHLLTSSSENCCFRTQNCI